MARLEQWSPSDLDLSMPTGAHGDVEPGMQDRGVRFVDMEERVQEVVPSSADIERLRDIMGARTESVLG